MNRLLLLSSALLLALSGCQREEITISPRGDDLFFVQNRGASMPVKVEGNTASGVLLVVVHGGPGSDAIKTMNGDWMDPLETRYAVAYWDQRNGGSTQGGANHDQLTVPNFADDLKKVVLVLRHRYGSGQRVFLYSHSWGGLVAAAFLTTADNQQLVSGWLNLDGATNFPLKDAESRAMQLRVGAAEVAAGRRVAEWEPLLAYARANDPAASVAVRDELNVNAYQAIKLMDEVNRPERVPTNDLRYSPVSVASSLVNFQSVYFRTGLQAEAYATDLSPRLPRLRLPVLGLFGQYDFVVPPAVGQDVLNRVGSAYKQFVVLPRSGHDPYFTEPDAVNAEVVQFVERFR